MYKRKLLQKMRIAALIFAVCIVAASVLAQGSPACKGITIVGPAGITMPGGSMILKLESGTPLPTDTKFEWTVSAGTIVSGQDTGSIEVIAAPDGSSEYVSAKVKITGLQPPCDEIVSEAYGISSPIVDPFLDIWGRLNRNDERVRLQNAAFLLSRNPGSILVLVVYLAPNESAAEANRRALYIRNFFAHDRVVMSKDLYVPPSRLRVAFARAEDTHTSVYLFPPADFPSFLKSFDASLRPEDLKPVENHR